MLALPFVVVETGNMPLRGVLWAGETGDIGATAMPLTEVRFKLQVLAAPADASPFDGVGVLDTTE